MAITFIKDSLNKLLRRWALSEATFLNGIPAPSTYIIQEPNAKIRRVYANHNFKKGEIIEHAPVILIECSFDELPQELRSIVFDWEALAKITYPCQAIALGLGNLYQHSNNPNLSFIANTEDPSIVFTATRAVKHGEELTIDYRRAGSKFHLIESP